MLQARLIFFYLLGFIFLIANSSNGQAILNTINLYGTNFPQEKIHIHFDKESYLPGETIWFKAYLFEENLPSERSTNLYTAIYNEQGNLISSKVSPVFKGSSDGHFEIPDTLKSSQIICRAFTSWMQNFDTSLFFNQAIKVITTNEQPVVIDTVKKMNLRFFPEGGDLIEGTVNTIAFKCNLDNGQPVAFKGVLKKQETGETIMPLEAVHDGMGRFDIEIQPGEKYYAAWIDTDGKEHQTWLPEAKKIGVSLKVTVQKDKLYFNVVNKTGADSLHVLMYMYQKVFYKTDIRVSTNESYTGMVPISSLPSGTIQITIFDAGWQPVAERVAFINNNNFSFNLSVKTNLVSMVKRGKNMLEITVADTIPANMSLSITDADMNDGISESTILTNMLLKGDIKGYIHNPAYYFSSNTDVTLKNKLDLVMLTHGWRRYSWSDIMVQKMPHVKNAPDNFLGIYGRIGEEALSKMEKDELVNLIVKTVDSINTFYSIKPNQSGYLIQNGLIFFDTARIYYTMNKSKLLNKQITFSKSTLALTQPVSIKNYKDYIKPGRIGTVFNENTNLFSYYKSNNGISQFNAEKTIEGVVVQSNRRYNWKNDPLLKLDEKYASGLFTGGANSFSLDVLHDEKAWTKLDFYSYIRSMVPGLVIGNFNLASGRSLTYGGLPVLVYIDEHEMETTDLENLSLTQIAYIKLIPNFMGRGADPGGRSINPAISVYTRKGDDLVDKTSKETDLNMIKVGGYSRMKEFYSPDYSNGNNTGTDARTTLLWMPYILTDKNYLTVPITFYNNDFTKKMRLVLEGINDEGKLIRYEKIIE